jgi:hypothetical protein
MFRKPVNKKRSVRSFRKNVGRSKVVNLRAAPQRGGWRL